jgi:glycosyltransferase involved in cell wall biosynthesis
LLIIGIDTRFALKKRRGIGNYTLNLVHQLAKIDKKNQYILYTDKPDYDNLLPNNYNFKVKPLFPVNYLLWEQKTLPEQLIKDGVNIVHCTANTTPILINKKIKLITTVHDVMFLKNVNVLPQSDILYQRLGRTYRSLVIKKTINLSSKIITVSKYSKSDILQHFPDVQEELIQITYESADSAFEILETEHVNETIRDKLNINNKYLLTLGGTDPRKNTKLVIKAFAKMKQEKEIDLNLVIVGIPNWKETEFYKLVCSLKLEKEIKFTDFISQNELVCLYNYATLFLYPSLYEGFGIPPLEAMACGTPVITSNTTSIPEIVGDAALQINPNSQEELEAAIIKLLRDDSLRNELIKRGFTRAKQFSWRKMAEETLDIYKSVFAGESN